MPRDEDAAGKGAAPQKSAPPPPPQAALSTRTFAVDMAAATATAFVISPFIVTIDKAVCDAAVNRHTMFESVKLGVKQLLTRPHQYLSQRAFIYVWGIYIATYGAVNIADTLCMKVKKDELTKAGVDPALPKFIVASAVNLPLSIFQDRCFVRWFGVTRVRPVTAVTYSFWAMRDMGTMGGSFCLPEKVSPLLENAGMSPAASITAAQIMVPSFIALTLHPPLHLLGIDIYNRPELKMSERSGFVKDFFARTSLMRFCRILPAFGIGGVVNRNIRNMAAEDG